MKNVGMDPAPDPEAWYNCVGTGKYLGTLLHELNCRYQTHNVKAKKLEFTVHLEVADTILTTVPVRYVFRFGQERKALATMSGIFVAIGEVLGGAVFGIFGHLTVKRGRDPIVMLGFVLSMVAYFLVFLNIPNEAPAGETTVSQTAFIGQLPVPSCNLQIFFYIPRFRTHPTFLKVLWGSFWRFW